MGGIGIEKKREFFVTWSEVAQSCLTLRDPMDCSLPCPSVHGIFQTRVLEWVTTSFNIQCIILKFHLCSRLVLIDRKKDVLIFFQGKSHLLLVIGHKFPCICKNDESWLSQKRIPANSIVIWNATNFVLAALPRKRYEKKEWRHKYV